jgi:hypothetical protein
MRTTSIRIALLASVLTLAPARAADIHMSEGDKVNRSIEVPAYVPDVAKVQIWVCLRRDATRRGVVREPGEMRREHP